MAHLLVPPTGEHLPGVGPAVGSNHLNPGRFASSQRHPGDAFRGRLGRDVERASVASSHHVLDHQDVGPAPAA